MNTEALSRIDEQIFALSRRLSEVFDQLRLNAQRIERLAEHNILLRQKLERSKPGLKHYVYDDAGICVAETYTICGAAPFGKEE